MQKGMIAGLWAVLLSVGLIGCGVTPKTPVRDDPLIGRVFDRAGQEISRDSLLDRMAESDVIYLGEKHDNAEQHRQQAAVVRELLARGVRPALGFEFFEVGQTSLLMQYVQASSSAMQLGHREPGESREQRLRERLGWADREDEEWGYYFALLELAREEGLAVFGADLPAGLRLRLSRVGVEGLNAVERSQLVESDFQHGDYRALMFEKFTDAHCGWGEPSLLQRLYETWVARNERMATSVLQMLDEASQRPVVMILGKGHTEYGMGVVERVAARGLQLDQLNLGLAEISIEPQPLAAYLEATQVGETRFPPKHDYLWFFQRQDYRDPCAGFNTPG